MKTQTPLSNKYIENLTNILMAIAIIGSAFHFWPAEENKLWQFFNFSNSAIFIWFAILPVVILKNKSVFLSYLPDNCIWCYLVINLLSIAFAKDINRSVAFNIKLTTIMIAGYTLISFSGRSVHAIKRIYHFVTIAALITVSAGLITKYSFVTNRLGFHNNIFKYGTYIAPIAVLCGVYYFDNRNILKKLFAAILVGAAILSTATLGALVSILTGMLAAVFIIKDSATRFLIITCVSLAVITLFTIPAPNKELSIKNDVKLTETDSKNIRQRYIEWQAELNMLEKRSAAGTAAGSINDYRSEFYYRLPKLNTLKAFDLNGWLACGAETGSVGLMSLAWIFFCYSKKNWTIIFNGKNRIKRFAKANLVGLIAAAAANIFGSLMYNGIIIVFVLILAISSNVQKIGSKEIED